MVHLRNVSLVLKGVCGNELDHERALDQKARVKLAIEADED
jgi:hypothetical protein